MGMTFLSFISVALLLQNFSGQINADTENEMIDAINSFGLDLYKKMTNHNERNLACSGYGASTALNMLLAGARKKTEKELRSALRYDKLGITKNEAEDAYHTILTKQRNKQNGYDLYVSNSMWIQAGFIVLPEFKDTIKNKFYAEEQEVDFARPDAAEKINRWVSTETKQKIPKLFGYHLRPGTRLLLVNAMYFKGTWKTQFNESLTEPHPFRASTYIEKRRVVQMMNVRSEFPYGEDSDLKAQILELPYDGDNVSMVVVLPKDARRLSTHLGKWTLNALKNAVNKLSNREVDVRIPKFEISSIIDLEEYFNGVGVKEAYSPEADLSGINGKRDISVSNAIQKAIIEVNEKGTVAAASTGIDNFPFSPFRATPYTSFTADHPFVFFIRHKPTGLFLFMGRMTHPDTETSDF